MAGGINPFVYVLNDPVNKIDPLGLFGFAFDGGGGYGQGEAGGDDPEGKNYGTGIYGGVKPNSQGHAQIGAFTYQSDADQMIFAPRFGGGVNGTVYYGDANLINNEIDRYMKVTREDIQRVAKEYFRKDNRVVLHYVPKSKEENK